MDDDDKVPRGAHGFAAHRRRLIAVVAGIVVVALVAGLVSAFHNASAHLAAVHRDTAVSTRRVAALSLDVATATRERDASRRAAAIARDALAQARTAHLRGADALAVERDDLARTRTQAYASLVDVNTRSTQLSALHTCLDGVAAALDMLGSGDVNGWQQRLQLVDPSCQQAEAAT